MKHSQYTLEVFLYIHSNADLIVIAATLIRGGVMLRLSLTEAIAIIRQEWKGARA